MSVASHNDVSRLFPGIEDHAAADLLAMRPSIAELEAVVPFWIVRVTCRNRISERHDSQGRVVSPGNVATENQCR